VSRVEERKADRLRVMNEIYTEVGDNSMELVDIREIQERLGFTDDKVDPIVDYLVGEGLIASYPTMSGQTTVSITHAGVKEMERSEEHPKEPTDHFPPQAGVTINVAGNMVGSAIQSNSAGATQHVEVGDITIGAETGERIRKFLDEFEAKRSQLQPEQTADGLAEVTSDVATVRAQLSSPKPKKTFIRESLASIRAVLENGMGGVVTAGLLELLSQIHL
jgi:DNA-binding MarR family transcriptional regulator